MHLWRHISECVYWTAVALFIPECFNYQDHLVHALEGFSSDISQCFEYLPDVIIAITWSHGLTWRLPQINLQHSSRCCCLEPNRKEILDISSLTYTVTTNCFETQPMQSLLLMALLALNHFKKHYLSHGSFCCLHVTAATNSFVNAAASILHTVNSSIQQLVHIIKHSLPLAYH